MAKEYVRFSADAEKIAQERWPGATTLVLPRVAGEEAIGVRVPGHDWLRGLIADFGKPLIGTSANRSGENPTTTAQAAATAFPELKLVVDGGDCNGAPSEVIDYTVSPPKILRGRDVTSN